LFQKLPAWFSANILGVRESLGAGHGQKAPFGTGSMATFTWAWPSNLLSSINVWVKLRPSWQGLWRPLCLH
jgi:hypothetical protein